jgi:hypothetical protein
MKYEIGQLVLLKTTWLPSDNAIGLIYECNEKTTTYMVFWFDNEYSEEMESSIIPYLE